MITKPMLAGRCTDKSAINFPVLATPKLDGIRCLVINGKAVSRNFKPIPNKFVRAIIEDNFPDGCDGELMIPGQSFNTATGLIMRGKNCEPVKFQYFVFDYVKISLDRSYQERMKDLQKLSYDYGMENIMVKILPVVINNIKELNAFEEKCLKAGYEGVMIRTPDSPYKCGRSTEKEGYLLKIKQFEDSEAFIIGFNEKMHNDNEAGKDVFGHTERKHRKAGMRAADTLGNLVVKDSKTGIVFEVGSGFDDELRKEIWRNQSYYLGKMITYKHQPYGKKEKPRFPIFKGFRNINDMSEG